MSMRSGRMRATAAAAQPAVAHGGGPSIETAAWLTPASNGSASSLRPGLACSLSGSYGTCSAISATRWCGRSHAGRVLWPRAAAAATSGPSHVPCSGTRCAAQHRWRLQPRVGAHFAARSLCLILVPFALYCASFALHFAVLTHSGPGDSAMPSLFQAGLVGSKLGQQPEGLPALVRARRSVGRSRAHDGARGARPSTAGSASHSWTEVHFGSTVTLRNHGHAGALLHSHVQTYPAGSKQQQVMLWYPRPEHNARGRGSRRVGLRPCAPRAQACVHVCMH